MSNSIIMAAANYVATFGVSGTATASIPIPGATGVNNGRHIRRIQVWTPNGVDGDAVTSMRVEDTDRVMRPGGVTDEQMQAQFPNYPTLFYFHDNDLVEDNNFKKGFSIPLNMVISFEPVDPRDNGTMRFIPKGLYIIADFSAGNGGTGVGRKIRINFIWARPVSGV